MDKSDKKRVSYDLANEVDRVLRFSQTSLGRGTPTFHFGDFPFAVSVFCIRQGQGYVADYWVSGRRWSDDEPRLVMRVTAGINEVKFIEGAVNYLWQEQLQEIAFSSAIVGGFLAATSTLDLEKKSRDEMLSFHLLAHDRFAQAMGGQKKSKVEQTAKWFNLITSFGVKQTQQIIASHQWVADLAGDELTSEEFAKREKNRLLAINARISTARKRGLLISIPSTGTSTTTTRRSKENVESSRN